MYKGKKILAIIPARSGSKGLPQKNIKSLNGKPVIAWSILAAMNSQYLDEVIVSTDCPNIAKISNKYGAKTPFLRPDHLATDTASSSDTILHLLEYQSNKGKHFDYIVLLEPTSPLRETSDIDLAIEQLSSSPAESIVGVSLTEDQHPAFLAKIQPNGFLSQYEDRATDIRRQDIDKVYFHEGTIYISDIKVFLEKRTFYHDKTIAYIVPKYKSFELDDIYDFVMIEAIMRYHNY